MKKGLATVAIIGRPNTGKSTLFNRYIGERRSIESGIAGTTRDSLIEKTEGESHEFFLVDTAGLTNPEGDSLEERIQVQAEVAGENADILIFLVDGLAPLTQDDYTIAEKLRKSQKPVLFVANKLDDGDESRSWHLSELGLGMPIVISAKNNVAIHELTEAIETELKNQDFPGKKETREIYEDETTRIAFVGRPNVGKSSLLNKLLNKERSVVSPIAGTTRDTIDSEIWWDEEKNELFAEQQDFTKKFLILDTAGLRRPGKIERNFEFWSAVRTQRAIERSDVCCLIIDALDGVTHQDLAIAGKILEAGKGLILCVNKFDLVIEKSRAKEETDEREVSEVKMWGERLDKIRENYLVYLSEKVKFLNWAPVLFFSAKTGKGVQDVFVNAVNISRERAKRISTSQLNNFIPEIFYKHVAPSIGTKVGKIKYASQVETAPPKFLFHVNNKDAFHFTYQRYIENKLRDKFGFHGTPIEVKFKDSMEDFRGNKKKKR